MCLPGHMTLRSCPQIPFRKLSEMADLLSEAIVAKASPSPQRKAAPPGSAKLSRKERMKLELKQELGDELGAVFQQMDAAKSKTESRLHFFTTCFICLIGMFFCLAKCSNLITV